MKVLMLISLLALVSCQGEVKLLTTAEHIQQEISTGFDNKFEDHHVKMAGMVAHGKSETHYFYGSDASFKGNAVNILFERSSQLDQHFKSTYIKEENLKRAIAGSNVDAEIYVIAKPNGTNEFVTPSSGQVQEHPSFTVVQICSYKWKDCKEVL